MSKVFYRLHLLNTPTCCIEPLIELGLLLRGQLHRAGIKDDLGDSPGELVRHRVLIIHGRLIIGADVKALEPYESAANCTGYRVAVHGSAIDAEGTDSALADAAKEI